MGDTITVDDADGDHTRKSGTRRQGLRGALTQTRL
jgi:hypothetical protein